MVWSLTLLTQYNKKRIMKIKSSELPLQPSGAVYHLNLFPEEIADKIIVVGDPGRVAKVSSHFDHIDIKRENREIFTHTGIYRGKHISVLSTGMGTDNIDIVLNELDALANIDLATREVKESGRSFTIVRIGTCGALQPDIPVNTFIASDAGFGFDGLLHFYDYKGISDEAFVESFVKQTGWNERLPYPYCVEGDENLMQTIGFDMFHGITASAGGFYGPQGRELRGKLKYPELNEKIEQFSYQDKRITNLEMETSALYGLSKMLGHKALTVCVAIANRVTKEFSKDYKPYVEELIKIVLDRI